MLQQILATVDIISTALRSDLYRQVVVVDR